MQHPAPPRKLASQNAVFKKAFARGCTDRLRAIESRLDFGCGTKWLTDLDACDDLHGVSKLLLQLQRRCCTLKGVDCGWLDELCAQPPAAFEEQQAEISRRLMHRLDELDRTVPPARKPSEMLGEVVLKHFEGHGTFIGTIIEYDERTGFRLQYDDGDTEDVSLRDLRLLMPRPAADQVADSGDAVIGSAQKRASACANGSESGHQDTQRPAQPEAPPPGARKKQLLQAATESAEVATTASDRGAAQKRSAAPADRSNVGSAEEAGSSKKAKAEDIADELALLPPGWVIEARSRGKTYISPDGLTRFSTLAKVQRWHKQQMSLASRFQLQREQEQQREKEQQRKRLEREQQQLQLQQQEVEHAGQSQQHAEQSQQHAEQSQQHAEQRQQNAEQGQQNAERRQQNAEQSQQHAEQNVQHAGQSQQQEAERQEQLQEPRAAANCRGLEQQYVPDAPCTDGREDRREERLATQTRGEAALDGDQRDGDDEQPAEKAQKILRPDPLPQEQQDGQRLRHDGPPPAAEPPSGTPRPLSQLQLQSPPRQRHPQQGDSREKNSSDIIASGKKVPRELRNLVIPDREWNVPWPFEQKRESSDPKADTPAALAQQERLKLLMAPPGSASSASRQRLLATSHDEGTEDLHEGESEPAL